MTWPKVITLNITFRMFTYASATPGGYGSMHLSSRLMGNCGRLCHPDMQGCFGRGGHNALDC